MRDAKPATRRPDALQRVGPYAWAPRRAGLSAWALHGGLALASLVGPAVDARADDNIDAALSLADQVDTGAKTAPADAPRDWQLALEAAAGREHVLAQARDTWRTSVDFRLDKPLASTLRAIFSDRFDETREPSGTGHRPVNTLREAYASWQCRPDRIVDAGRVNARQGVAYGYNPTDFFRGDAVRSIISVDPDSLRRNRLGTVMLRGQALGDGSAISALVAPKLADQASDSPYSADLGATNRRTQWMVALSDSLSSLVSTQLLVYGGQGQSAQLGANLTALVGNATIAYLEMSGGRLPDQVSQAVGMPADRRYKGKLSTGATYTAANKLSLTLEWEWNGAGLSRAQWQQLRDGVAGGGAGPTYAAYRGWAAAQQEMPTRQNVFAYVTWKDVVVPRLDLAGLIRRNPDDGSAMSWLETRYHWNHLDLALQWTRAKGHPTSEFGALPQRSSWQLVLVHFS